MKEIRALLQIMARLRSPQGCHWDRKQTHQTLRPMMLEEVYELLEAIEQKDDHALQEELGDVLLHLIFHAQRPKSAGRSIFARSPSDWPKNWSTVTPTFLAKSGSLPPDRSSSVGINSKRQKNLPAKAL